MLDINKQRRSLQDALAEARSSDLNKLRGSLALPIQGHDTYDQADDSAGKELVVLRLNQCYMKIARARIAASKLNEGLEVYVTCSGCDGVIAESRLVAVPWAILCVRCQEGQDREGGDEVFVDAPAKGSLDVEVELELLAEDV